MSNQLCRCQKCTGQPPPLSYSRTYLLKSREDAILRYARQIAALYTFKERRAALDQLKTSAPKWAAAVEEKMKAL